MIIQYSVFLELSPLLILPICGERKAEEVHFSIFYRKRASRCSLLSSRPLLCHTTFFQWTYFKTTCSMFTFYSFFFSFSLSLFPSLSNSLSLSLSI